MVILGKLAVEFKFLLGIEFESSKQMIRCSWGKAVLSYSGPGISVMRIKETLPNYWVVLGFLSHSHTFCWGQCVKLLYILCGCFLLPSCMPIIFWYYNLLLMLKKFSLSHIDLK